MTRQQVLAPRRDEVSARIGYLAMPAATSCLVGRISDPESPCFTEPVSPVQPKATAGSSWHKHLATALFQGNRQQIAAVGRHMT